MPSRPLPPQTSHKPRAGLHLLIIAAAAASSLLLLALLILVALYLYFFLHRRSPTLPFDSAAASVAPLRRFSHRQLRSATRGFDPSRSLGRGASASVFRGILPDGKSVAVKRLDPTSAADADGREFLNELRVLAALSPSPFVVSLLGYCIEGRRRRLLVYEYMCNGSLQEALFGSRAAELGWDRRFEIILDVARALAFLHLECDPPVIHGDVKPSNVLLGSDYRAKLSDFGLSRINSETDPGIELFSQELGPSQELIAGSPKVDFAAPLHASSSNSCKNHDHKTVNTNRNARIGGESKVWGGGSPKGKEAATVTPCEDELCRIDISKELNENSLIDDSRTDVNGLWGKDWWWKQDGSRELCSKDYVREWIGTQIYPSKNPDWYDERKSSPENCIEFPGSNHTEKSEGGEETRFEELGSNPIEKRKPVKGLDACDKNNREMREWWKEEYFAEISKKGGKCRKGLNWFRTNSTSRGEESSSSNNNVSIRGRDLNVDISFRKGWKKKRNRSVSSDMWSGDLFSRELSSTTASMRGTVCYVAPECGGCGHLMDKADIYSFGVLILVIISGRRPLHVLSSPMKLEKANLISWSRQLVQKGNILELVDERLKESYNKDQASLCVNLALLCLQRTPELRPDSGDIVKILKGEMDLPVVPFEFSPSPTSKLFSKSRRRATFETE